ncbi:unnamed protein product, partial [Allacma fusca]
MLRRIALIHQLCALLQALAAPFRNRDGAGTKARDEGSISPRPGRRVVMRVLAVVLVGVVLRVV